MSTLSSSSLNRVGIIGRPNVGKSTLFNLLSRSRKALTKNQPGVTRDILNEDCEWWGSEFQVTDTGGLTEDKNEFSKLIKEQVVAELSQFDMLVVVVDARAGLIPEDRDVVHLAHEAESHF